MPVPIKQLRHSVSRFLLALLLVSQAWGYSIVTNNGQPVSLDPGSFTMQIRLGSALVLSDGSTYNSSVQTAMQVWNAQLGNVQLANQIGPAAAPVSNNNINEIGFDSTVYGTDFDANVLAVTVSYYFVTPRGDGSYRRSQADIIFNTAYTWDSYRGALRTPEDIRRVALHELGHVLGLDHPDQATPPQSVTALMNSLVSNLDTLAADDIAGAQSLYGSPNTTPAITSQPGGQSVYAGQTAQFAISANGAPAPTFRWQRLPAGSGTWANLTDGGSYTGTGTGTLSVTSTTTLMSGDQFRCVATNANGSATSNAANLTVTASTPPTITTQPSSQSVLEGGSVTFTAAATGVPVPTFQWQKDGVNIAGATDSSYTIATAAAGDAGSYAMVATNLAGTATSNAVILTVNAPPYVTGLSPARQVLVPGQALSLSVTATGPGSTTYQWVHNGKIVPSANGSNLTVAAATSADNGWYVLLATNSYGTRRSKPFFVAVVPAVTEIRAWGSNGYGELAIPGGLTDVIAIAAGDVTALALRRNGTVVAWGSDWRHGGNTAVPAGLSDVVAIAAGPFQSLALKSDGTVVSWGWYSSGLNPPPAGLDNVVAIAANELHSLALKSDGTVVIWGDNNNAVPAGLSGVVAIAAPGRSASMALKSDGTVAYWNHDLSGQSTVPAGLNDVVAIAGAFSNFYLALKSNGMVVAWGYDGYGNNSTVVPAGLSGVVAIDTGSRHSLALKSNGTVVAWGANDAGQSVVPVGLGDVFSVSAGSWFSLALRDATHDGLPVIVTQPVSQTALVENSVTFLVSATSGQNMTYQWRKGGANIAGAMNPTLTLANLALADAGNYDVVITNSLGSVTSATATLTVNPRPTVTGLSPTRQVLIVGQSLDLSVSATGTGELGYQWTHSGRVINGATGSSFSIPSVTLNDAGWYNVLVTDMYGSRRSASIFVLVAPAQSRARAWGSNASYVSTVPAGLSDPVAISAAHGFAVLAVRRDGSVTGWGDNFQGQTTIPAGLANVVQVAVGYSHSVALKSDGTIVSWANNSENPGVPAGLSGVVAIAASVQRSVALKSDGTVVAWGSNYDGASTIPAGLIGLTAIAAGGYHNLGLKSDGTVVAWGSNGLGQCNVPAGLTGVIAIAAGANHSLALKSDGTVVAWGHAADGATRVPANLGNVVAISGGQRHSLALKSDGTVVGWGLNGYGETVAPAGLAHVWAISAGYNYSTALYDSSFATVPIITLDPVSQTKAETQSVTFTVAASSASALTYQWQKNGVAILGATSDTLVISNLVLSDSGSYRAAVNNYLGTSFSASALLNVNPIPVVTPQTQARNFVNPGQPVTLAVTATGTGSLSYQWTHNGRAIAGATNPALILNSTTVADTGYYLIWVTDANGTRISRPFFVIVAPSATNIVAWGRNTEGQSNVPYSLTDVAAISAGGNHALALRANGTVVSWGYNYYEQATLPAGLSDIVAVSGGGVHSMALKSDGTVADWGYIDGMPADVSNVVAIAAGGSHALALKNDGTVMGWGNYYGLANFPTGLNGVIAIAAGWKHSLALKADGTVVGWGDNSFGQAFPPSGLNNVVAIAAGESYSLARKADGSVVFWGGFNMGYFPTAVPAGFAGASAISSGSQVSFALKADGTVTGWSVYGNSNYGEGSVPAGLSRVFAISAGADFSLALRNISLEFAVQPVSQTVVAGNSVSFTVAASGTPAPTYQWQKNGVNIAGATSASYTITTTVVADAGSYTVVVTNSTGSVTSRVAVLTVASANGNAVSYGTTNFPLSAAAGTVINFSCTVTNTGAKAWGANHYLALLRGDGSLVQMSSLSGTVVGGNQAVIFSLPTPATAGTYQYRVQPLENGVEWFGSPVTLTLMVTPAAVSAQGNAVAYGSHSFPLSASAGSVVNFTYTVSNAGTKAWGANHYLALMQSDYSVIQLGSLDGTVAGGSKAVSLSLPVPATPGTYQYRLQPLENGVEWFGSPVTLSLTVTPAMVTVQGNALAYGMNSFPLSASAGSVVNFNYNVSNLGTKAWAPDHYLALLDAGFNLIEFAELNGIVAGGSTTANFSFPAPGTLGTYQYIVRPLENGLEWFGTQLSLSLIVTPAVVTAQGNALGYGTTTFPVTVNAGASVNFTYNVTNLGTKTWGASHYLALLDPSYNLVDFGDLATTTAGGSKAASLSFTAPLTPGTYHYILRPLENGLEWFGTEVHLTLTVL